MNSYAKNAVSIVVAGLLAGSQVFAGGVSVPMDAGMSKQIEEAIRSAVQEGNYNAALRDSRRLLELFPNNPTVQAPIYLTMSELAQKTGETSQASGYAATAKQIDPSLEKRAAAAGGATTRGGNSGQKLAAVLAIMGTTMAVIQQVQAQKAQQAMQMAQQMPPAAAPMTYPQAPIGAQNYQPSPTPPAPPVGWAPAPQQPDPYGQYSQPQAYPQPAPPSPYPQSAPPPYPQSAPSAYAQPAPAQAYPQSAPPPGYPQPAPAPAYAPPASSYPPAAPASPGYAPPAPPYPQTYPADPNMAAPGAQPAYPSAPAPYAVTSFEGGVRRTRGGAAPVIKVVHDHSRIGDKAYFEKSCGALLSFAEGKLTFTPAGGETPLVIPAAEIAEVRLNTTVGKNIGAFHIATKKGLYLNLAPESGSRDEARGDVEQIRKQLGFGD